MLRIPPDHRLDVAAPPRAATLPFLAAGARAQTDGTLALCAGVGVVVAAVALAVVPSPLPLALAAAAVAAFGGWGIVDRVAAERSGTSAGDGDGAASALRLARLALAVAGIAAALGCALAVLGVLLGRFIS